MLTGRPNACNLQAHENKHTSTAPPSAPRPRRRGKPILITEFGYVSFAGTNGHAYGEDVHARVLEAEYAAFGQPYICGATIWCWADHAWRTGSFMGGLSVSPYGVVTRDRQKLKPYWTARRLFSPPSSNETARARCAGRPLVL